MTSVLGKLKTNNSIIKNPFNYLKAQNFLGLGDLYARIKRHQELFVIFPPPANVTNLGYANSFFTYSEKNFYTRCSHAFYNHEGKPPLYLSYSEQRYRVMNNIYTAKLILAKKLTFEDVKKNWHIHKTFIEEMGCTVKELRDELLSIDYYDKFEELEPKYQESVAKFFKLVNTKICQRKLEEWQDLTKKLYREQQMKLWPFEYDRLKTLPTEIIEFDLKLRGYSLPYLLHELKANPKTPSYITESQANNKILLSLCFSDLDSLKESIAVYDDFYAELAKFSELYDSSKFSSAYTDAKQKALFYLAKFSSSLSSQEKIELIEIISGTLFSCLKPYAEIVLTRGEHKKFANSSVYNILRMKFFPEYTDYYKYDNFGLFHYFMSSRSGKVYRIIYWVGGIYLIAIGIGGVVVVRRMKRYEKEKEVHLGHRSSYYVKQSEQ